MHFFLAVALLSASQLQKNSLEDFVFRAAKEGLPDPTKPFTLVVKLKVKEGEGPKFAAAAAKLVKATRKEKGNLAYELNRSPKGSTYIMYERWANLAALEAHLKSAHFKNATVEINPLLGPDIEVDLFVPEPAGD
jgi:quinol monooxygenase YgiN